MVKSYFFRNHKPVIRDLKNIYKKLAGLSLYAFVIHNTFVVHDR